jgi:hypothetical protein
MRLAVASVLVVTHLAAPGAAAQSGTGVAAGKPAIGACALLSRELAAKYTTLQNKRTIDLIPPEEESIGTHGSMCEFAGIGFQLNPFVRSEVFRNAPRKDWQTVAGLGDTAFFHNNANRWAELIVWTGRHHFTIQMSVPTGATAESVKPNATGLATELIAKLK